MRHACFTQHAVHSAVLASLLTLPASAGNLDELVDDASTHTISYDSDNVPQDFIIPDTTGYIRVAVRGGRGGNADAGGCTSDGGRSVLAEATFRIHPSDPDALRGGGILRFVIGRRGYSETVGTFQAAKGSGGGGSAVLYKESPGLSDNDFELLVVGGAGGGAYQGNFLTCVDTSPGGDARVGESGGDGGGNAGSDLGGNGGEDGEHGNGVLWTSYGGGGHLEHDNVLASDGGFPAGSDGATLWGQPGGWGYGGGGGGDTGSGGGGGYSGGGGGDIARRGGGGGSYVDSDRAVWESREVSNETGNGWGSYRLFDSGGATCEDAEPIGAGTIDGTTTASALSPTVSCFGPIDDKQVWYVYTNDKSYPIQVVATTENSGLLSTSVDVLSECDLTFPDIACGQPAQSAPHHRTATWVMQPGDVHYIRVAAGPLTGQGGGSFQLDVDQSLVPVTNDDCIDAIALEDFGTVYAETFGATGTFSTACAGAQAEQDVWFSWENDSGSDQCLDLRVEALAPIGGFSLEIYGGCGGDVITCVPVPLDQGLQVTTDLTWTVPAGATHWIRVVSSVPATNSPFELDISGGDCEPWVDLGGEAEGVNGAPRLDVRGSLEDSSVLLLDLVNAAPSSSALLFMSFSSTPTPLFGGTLYTVPIDVYAIVPTDANGVFSTSFLFGGAPTGSEFYFQALIADAAATEGFSLSNCEVGTAP